ncbi:hypothetical protein PRIPAC_78637 [Pristionchus pacificus]|uniref:Uncharacterized protein n=1 Tax=Pristionchus pacificus TaxID=54126 RepID=A0A2A6CPX8_PRIPA|nr:hypothetical protein PRIPAC_78637 [Pristionchus pacificus]|eukprot:PDM80265.1 hypothetical protein PRIPAC_32844 [Pristionchus pacificus]
MYLSLLIATVFLYGVHAAKETPDILSCASQIEGRVGGESNAKVKSTVEQLLWSVKTGDFASAQKALRETDEVDRTASINKYMVDACGSMKTCMVCPLQMA